MSQASVFGSKARLVPEWLIDCSWRYLLIRGSGPERLATGLFKFPEIGDISEINLKSVNYMGRHCQVCTHAAIHRINRELLGGAKLQPTATHYGVPLTSLHRHRTQCLGLAKADTAVSAPSKLAGIKAKLPDADKMGDLYGSLRDELTEIVTDARSRGQSMVAVTAIDKIRSEPGQRFPPCRAGSAQRPAAGERER